MRVPVVDLKREVAELWDELRPAVEKILRSGQFVLGPNLEAFEREAADYLGVGHAIGLNSGTDALVIGLAALGVGRGDEVITTPFTFVATAEAICRVGATPVFADIEPRTFNLDAAEIEKRITPRTRAVIPVHLFGHPAEMDPILAISRKHGLRVLEDAAQAFGAEYRGRKAGGLGDAAAFSFFPTKNLGAYGDGGMLTTDNDAVAESARKLRNHGALDKYRPELLGYNSRLDELQAAILRIKLAHLDAWNEARRATAEVYGSMFGSAEGLRPPSESPDARHIYHQYTLRVEGGARDEVRSQLATEGIGTAIYYALPIHRLDAYRDPDAECPNADRASQEVLSLPVGPHVSPQVAKSVGDEAVAATRRALVR